MPLATASDVDLAYNTTQAAIVDRVRATIAALWLQSFNVEQVDASAVALLPVFGEIISKGQASAVSVGLAYYAALMRTKGLSEDPGWSINPEAFLGIASAGFGVGPAASTLAAIATKGAIGRGIPPVNAGQLGLRRVLSFADTELQDTARAVVEMNSMLDARVVAYERVVNLPACGRCIVLAGKRYKKNLKFKRHPQDDCGMRPVTQDDRPFAQADNNPHTLLESMTPTQRARALGGQANQKAYDAGADASSLIDGQRGMRAAGDDYTVNGVTSRSLFAAQNRAAGLEKIPGTRYQVSKAKRLSPAGVLKAAGGDDALYRKLLERNAYIL